MKNKTFIRVNGRGNAWPGFIGKPNPFYSLDDSDDLSNASYSIINSKDGTAQTDMIKWELLIDAGNHTVPYIIKNENRIPEAIILTHPHLDHTLGIDWVVQSFYFTNERAAYPLYASLPCWEFVKQSYPHLVEKIIFKELKPGERMMIEETEDIFVTAYPVFHGHSAFGASMLLFEIGSSHKAVFTGDMLCPLLRKKDFNKLDNANVIYIDTNNRFPYPKSNHGSFTNIDPHTGMISGHLIDWIENSSLSFFLAPHHREQYDKTTNAYFDEFIDDNMNSIGSFIYTAIDLLKKIKISDMKLIHYGGMEDEEIYNQNILSDAGLEKWAQKVIKDNGIKVNLKVPKVGDIFFLE